MKAIISLLIVGLSACAPKAIIVDPIQSHVAKSRADVHAAAEGSQRVQKSVTTVHEQAAGIAAQASNLAAETDRLRKLPGVPLAEFDALWSMANDLKRETFSHEIKARETVEVAADSAHLQAVAETSMAELETTAKAQDKGVEKLKTQIVTQAGNAAIGQAVKGAFWTFAIFAFIALVVWGLSKLKPRIY